LSEILCSPILESLGWLEHGFGTRKARLSQERMASLRQIHSSLVHIAEGPGSQGEGDALISNLPGVALSIRTADCFPILLADTRTHAIAAIHAGWRGTASNILEAALSAMHGEYKTDPSDVIAAIGPGIGACCYEVGPEVALRFGRDGGHVHLDLVQENVRQLIAGGMDPGRIDITASTCTRCDPQRFHSYRREGDRAGRMISYIRVL
jgi:YfiH family protein